MEKDNQKLLIRGAQELGVSLGKREVELLDQYLTLLNKWSKSMNLTGLRHERDQVAKLLLDSLAVVPVLEHNMRVMDLGSGAGLPGIPVKVARPALDMVLLESRHKRVMFLKEAIRVLGLSRITVHHGRAEDFGVRRLDAAFPLADNSHDSMHDTGSQGLFNAILCRAIGKLGEIAGLTSALLAEGGLLVAMKGPDPMAELENDREEIEKNGFTLKEIRHYDLPQKSGKRSLVLLQKPRLR